MQAPHPNESYADDTKDIDAKDYINAGFDTYVREVEIEVDPMTPPAPRSRLATLYRSSLFQVIVCSMLSFCGPAMVSQSSRCREVSTQFSSKFVTLTDCFLSMYLVLSRPMRSVAWEVVEQPCPGWYVRVTSMTRLLSAFFPGIGMLDRVKQTHAYTRTYPSRSY